jgi:hypothetical protein
MSLTGISAYAPVYEIKTDLTGRFLEGQIYGHIQTRGVGPRTDKQGLVVKQIKSLTEADLSKSEARISSEGKITLK